MDLFLNDLPLRQPKLRELSKIVYEYLLIISPGQYVIEEVFKIKNIFRTKYGCEYAASLIPHLTLINFVQMERNEKEFIKYLNRFIKNVNPFEVQLNGFGKFSHHTIYVNVLTKKPIVKIVKDMKIKFSKLLQALKYSEPHFILNPHVTIARKMLEIQYNRAWEEWKGEEFNAAFQVNEIELLKRKITGGKCETIAKFRLEGNGFVEEQLSLLF